MMNNILLRYNETVKGPDNLRPISAQHNRAYLIKDNKIKGSYQFSLPELPEPDREEGRTYKLFGSAKGELHWYSKGEDGNWRHELDVVSHLGRDKVTHKISKLRTG